MLEEVDDGDELGVIDEDALGVTDNVGGIVRVVLCVAEGEEVIEIVGEGVCEVDTLGVTSVVGVSLVVAPKTLCVGDGVIVTLAVSDPDSAVDVTEGEGVNNSDGDGVGLSGVGVELTVTDSDSAEGDGVNVSEGGVGEGDGESEVVSCGNDGTKNNDSNKKRMSRRCKQAVMFTFCSPSKKCNAYLYFSIRLKRCCYRKETMALKEYV